MQKSCTIAGIIGIVLALILVVSCMTCLNSKPEPKPSDIGATSTLSFAGDPEVLIAVSTYSFDSMSKALIAKDWMGLKQLLDAGLVYSVPDGTRVLVIDSEYGKRKIRVLEGESTGRDGWVVMEALK